MVRSQRRSRAVLIRRFFLRIINVIATVLTLFTGIKDNPVVVGLTGRYKFIRSRLQDGSINYDMARMEAIKSAAQHDLADVGQSFSFFSTPDRSLATLGEDRSLCLRVNSMNATTYAVYYDDYWGNGPRRTVRYIYSISAPNCQVINFQPAWYQACISDMFNGDQSVCHRFIFDHFNDLLNDQLIHVGTGKDFGQIGMSIFIWIRTTQHSWMETSR